MKKSSVRNGTNLCAIGKHLSQHGYLILIGIFPHGIAGYIPYLREQKKTSNKKPRTHSHP